VVTNRTEQANPREFAAAWWPQSSGSVRRRGSGSDVRGHEGGVAADTSEARRHGGQERQTDEVEARFATHDASIVVWMAVEEDAQSDPRAVRHVSGAPMIFEAVMSLTVPSASAGRPSRTPVTSGALDACSDAVTRFDSHDRRSLRKEPEASAAPYRVRTVRTR
jgi:hypothetical protein